MDDIYQNIATKTGVYRNEVKNIMNSIEFRMHMLNVTQDNYIGEAVKYVKGTKLKWAKERERVGHGRRISY